MAGCDTCLFRLNKNDLLQYRFNRINNNRRECQRENEANFMFETEKMILQKSRGILLNIV